MLRGNHECKQMSEFFDFKKEVIKKYELDVYDAFVASFNALPLACILNGRFLAIHAGLSPVITTVLLLKLS
jgi:serine/threonine-protein phosphatase 2B catalytic subunit